jgi:hypothetical protein
MGQLPHVFNDEIVTYPASGASGKMVSNCDFAGLCPDILGDDWSLQALVAEYQIQEVKFGREHVATAETAHFVLLTGRRAHRLR